MQARKYIISGGGTGGHIFPAVAIANALKAQNPGNQFLFVGALGRMEMEKVPAAGYTIIGLPITGIQRKLSLSNLAFFFRLFKSISQAKKIIREFKPDAVIGVGGYASAAVVYAATKKHIPTLIQEQNSFAGLTNKWLGKNVNRICVAFEGMERYFPKEKIVITGNPVRKEILQVKQQDRTYALQTFGLKAGISTVLIIGGSLGARTINESIYAGLQKLTSQGIQVIWQTGKGYYETAKSMVSENVKVFDFIQDMTLAYAAADIVISRAGAISVSELCIAGKPCILVPSPNVAEDHQTKNAMALINKQAAILVTDSDARNILVPEAIALLNNPLKQKSLADNITLLAKPDATAQIVKEINSLS